MTLLIVYCILGPGLWALLAGGMIFSYARLNRLRRPIAALADDAPRVTVLIPAKDEGQAVRACLDRVLALQYSNFRVIAIDDRSGDNTGAIFDEYAQRFPEKVVAEHVRALPAGWLGKCNALASATPQAAGEWLLFVDSDVKVDSDSLSAVLGIALARGYDAVSIMTRLECHTFWEHLLLPLCAASVGSMALMLYTNNDHYTTRAFANGQFLLIRRSAYEAVGGHGAVRDRITEDVALVRLLKANGSRVRIFLGRDFASTRMHATLKQMFHGWARIFSGVSNRKPWSILVGIVFTLSGLSAYVAGVYAVDRMLWHRDIDWIAAVAMHLLLMMTLLSIIYRLAANPRRYAALFPLAGVMLVAIFVYALRACRTGRIAWRGTSYTSAAAQR